MCEDFINSCHDVEVVAVAHVILVGSFKFDAVAGASAGIYDEDSPTLADKKIGKGRVGIGELSPRAAMYVDDQRNFSGGGLRRQVEKTFNGEARSFPSDQF